MASRTQKKGRKVGPRVAFREAALALVKLGLPVFPCDDDKRPLTEHGFHDATTDALTIERWAKKWPEALVGVPTGTMSGLFVLDIDPDGLEWRLDNLMRLGTTRIHRTRRNGFHYVYRMPNFDIRSSAGKIAPGVDLRANGGYIIFWAVHGLSATGDIANLSEPPAWLVEACTRGGSAESRVSLNNDGAIAEGSRNDSLTRLAGRMRRSGASDDEILASLVAFNAKRCIPPLEETELRNIARSIARYPPASGYRSGVEPTPLISSPPDPEDYPVDALGPVLSPAARAIMEHVQVPAALAANSVLAAAAVAAQAHANVATLSDVRPLSLYILTIAPSGDRKTTADSLALAPVRERIRQLHDGTDEWDEHLTGQTRDELGMPYTNTRKPWILCSEPTAEGLIYSLVDGQFSQGIFTDEGGQFLGSYAMGKESELRMISLLSRAWQGDMLERIRAKDDEHITLFGRRLSMHLLAQPEVASILLGKPLYRQQGILARFLIARPNSLAGSRIHSGKHREMHPDNRLVVFRKAITALLRRVPAERKTHDGLEPRVLFLSRESRALLVEEYNRIEKAQTSDGKYSTIREFASKASEHACRIAGVIALTENPNAGEITAKHMKSGMVLAGFYLSEYLRLVGSASVPPEVDSAQALLRYIARNKLFKFKLRRIQQYGPPSIRLAPTARAALYLLQEFGWVSSAENGDWLVGDAAQAALAELFSFD